MRTLPNVKNFRTRSTSRREEFSKLQNLCASELEELLNVLLDIRTGNDTSELSAGFITSVGPMCITTTWSRAFGWVPSVLLQHGVGHLGGSHVYYYNME
jgi:hypothetical protein